MSRRGKRRSRPVPDANIKRFVTDLKKALTFEDKYKADLASLDESSLAARDAAAKTLRFLKFWLDLPSETLFAAVGFLDRFLTKVKVQEKYLSCVSISCLYVASETHKHTVDAAVLINVSQTKCSINDMKRMCDIIRKKLDVEPDEQPITVYSYLNLILRLFECAATKLNVKPLFSRTLQKKNLLRRLEVVMSSRDCASDRYPMIALALIQYEIERFLAAEVPSKSPYHSIEILHLLTIIVELQNVCMGNAEELCTCYKKVKDVLKKYDDYTMVKRIEQKMNWQFSIITLFNPRPLDAFRTNLSMISEGA